MALLICKTVLLKFERIRTTISLTNFLFFFVWCNRSGNCFINDINNISMLSMSGNRKIVIYKFMIYLFVFVAGH